MVRQIEVGDGVSPKIELHLTEMAEADVIHYIARPTTNKEKEPYKIFDAFVGIYMGEYRVSQYDRRAQSKKTMRLFHRFLFGGQLVLIDPQHVEVVSRFSESET